ncbi:hypothetical protein HGRIS_005881 [Hohenbuehelia grisea]|uniref:Phytochrome chromophore attachment site domain-containing protein n=1 Tax=Hohenbuehelia grisea TaxID=104357 RepID=A0ABR3K0L0_9AGAR
MSNPAQDAQRSQLPARHPETLPASSSSSFVYPVRSLFQGKLQPSAEHGAPSLMAGSRSRSADNIVSLAASESDSSTNGQSIPSGSYSGPPSPKTSRSSPTSPAEPTEPAGPSTVRSKPHRSQTISGGARSRKHPRKHTPNYRHFPAGSKERQTLPTFSTTRLQGGSSSETSPAQVAIDSLSTGFGRPVEFDSVFRDPQRMPDNSRHPPPLPTVAFEAFSFTSLSLLPQDAATPAAEVEQRLRPPTDLETPLAESQSSRELPFNLSEYGLVHLGPPSEPRSGSSASSHSGSHPSRHSSSRSSNRSTYYSVSQNTQSSDSADNKVFSPLPEVEDESVEDLDLVPPSNMGTSAEEISSKWLSAEAANSLSEDQYPPSSPSQGGNPLGIHLRPSSSGQSPQPGVGPSSGRSSMQGSNSSSRGSKGSHSTRSSGARSSASGTGSSNSSNLYTHFRFEHQEDDDGHYVVLGREGKLAHCEDEPIRTPGAVQGFGVLIVVEETEDTLVVRQVSENSTEILGLPPKFLFSLECFSDTLPESQAGLLWDNIQFLTEPNPQTADEETDSPHVFLLTGYGVPDPGRAGSGIDERPSWTCWCAVHRPPPNPQSRDTGLIIMELELERDVLNPLYPPVSQDPPIGFRSPESRGSSTDESETTLVGATDPSARSTTESATPSASSSTGQWSPTVPDSLTGLSGTDEWVPSAEDIMESTTSRSKPLLALERLRRFTRTAEEAETPKASGSGRRSGRRGRAGASGSSGGVGMMDVFAVMAQINEQLGAAPDLETFLKVVVGVLKDLTQFHRVMIYQFDENWNGQVVAELVDWSRTNDLFRGLHFPAADIPKQARDLYVTNKVRVLYDRAQPTARIVVRNKEDLENPLDMSHCYLRAMSPIHIKYLGNMGVRASMSISIMAFGALWGLVTCHSFGTHGMRVSFPVRQMLRLLCQSISRNIERLSYAQRLHTRKLINTMSSENHPTGYIVSNANDLLGLFDADYGILVVGEGAKILGPNMHGQDILIMAEYLRLKQSTTIQASQAVTKDFPDLQLSTGLEVIAGLLYVPLSSEGKDFIAFFRKGQPRSVHWAGRPEKPQDKQSSLEPRRSFKTWSETVMGRCRAWTDEQLETAGVLALVYGKFIEVWRQKQDALQATKLTNLLLSNASHEVRTPLNHIINYLEMALNGSLDLETRDNLSRSHTASKACFTSNFRVRVTFNAFSFTESPLHDQ